MRHPDEYEADLRRLAKEAFEAAFSEPTPFNSRELEQVAQILTDAGNRIVLRAQLKDVKP